MGQHRLDQGARRYFRDVLREARATALRDAEAYDGIIHGVERLGVFLTQAQTNLSGYQDDIQQLAAVSPLSDSIPQRWRHLHRPFSVLYELVRRGRNAAMHEGASARHITLHAIELALVLEDALMMEMDQIGDYMVRNPVYAALWQPLSFIRQEMLVNSFSYLPVAIEERSGKDWRLVSDLSIACYLRAATSGKERERRLAKPLKEAADTGGLELLQPFICEASESLNAALKSCKGLPILVCTGDGELRGIVTAFDLM